MGRGSLLGKTGRYIQGNFIFILLGHLKTINLTDLGSSPGRTELFIKDTGRKERCMELVNLQMRKERHLMGHGAMAKLFRLLKLMYQI